MHRSHQADILFCQQYAHDLITNKSDSFNENHQLAKQFIDNFPLTSSSLTSPKGWTHKDNDINERFEQTATALLQPSLLSVLGKMFSVQRLAYFFAAGLIGTVFVKTAGVSAMPLDGLSGPVERSVDLHYKGEFVDTATGKPFDLFVEDDSLEPATAFSHYLAGANSTEHLTKRSWYDCKHLSNIQTLGCNTAHGIGGFVSATGSAAAGSYIGTLLSEAFNGKRDNQKPRSVCLSRDGDNLCVSWATYDTAKLKAGEANTIEQFSVQCGQSKGSAEFKTVMNDGGILFICVSNRADGCDRMSAER